MGILTGFILLVVGLVACFFGKRYYRFVLALFGFTLGYYSVAGLLAGQAELIQGIGAIVGGLIVGFLFWSFYKFAYVIFGAFVGLAFAAIIGQAFNLDGTIFLVLAIVLAVIGAFVGQRMASLIIQFSTAFGGATQAIAGLASLGVAMNIALPLADPTHGGANTESAAGIITLVAVLLLGMVGFLFQRGALPKPN